jgi:mannose-6-phosphate isomerase-like protein (cupin superfamily)
VVIEDKRYSLQKETGIFIRKGERFSLCSETRLRLLLTVCPGNAEISETSAVTSQEPGAFDDPRVGRRNPALRNTMADRYYQVLIGEHSGSDEVAQFIGEVPLSKAAPHRHLYEEAIAVLSGSGVMWTEHKRTLVDSGDIIFLPAQQEHSLQCTDKAGLALVGHFYPSGEPNINY